MSNSQAGDQENFISIPFGMDCRRPGQKAPIPEPDWTKTGGMTFGCDWQASDWRKDRHDDK